MSIRLKADMSVWFLSLPLTSSTRQTLHPRMIPRGVIFISLQMKVMRELITLH